MWRGGRAYSGRLPSRLGSTQHDCIHCCTALCPISRTPAALASQKSQDPARRGPATAPSNSGPLTKRHKQPSQGAHKGLQLSSRGFAWPFSPRGAAPALPVLHDFGRQLPLSARSCQFRKLMRAGGDAVRTHAQPMAAGPRLFTLALLLLAATRLPTALGGYLQVWYAAAAGGRTTTPFLRPSCLTACPLCSGRWRARPSTRPSTPRTRPSSCQPPGPPPRCSRTRWSCSLTSQRIAGCCKGWTWAQVRTRGAVRYAEPPSPALTSASPVLTDACPAHWPWQAPPSGPCPSRPPRTLRRRKA